MAASWRGFKSRLTRSWILRFKEKPELLKHPPKKYRKFITQPVWDDFVKDRLSYNFLVKSNVQSERRRMNKYDHHLSKKGYAGLGEDMKKEMGSSYKDERSLKWRRARQKKNGDYVDTATKKVVKNMLELEKKVEDGSIVIEGSSDILTMALGTSEHSGRVRGVGFGVTPTTYFHLPRRGSKKYMKELESKYVEECRKRKELEQRFNDLQAQMKLQSFTPVIVASSEKVDSNTHKGDNQRDLISTTNTQGSFVNSKSQSQNNKLKGAYNSKSQESRSHPMGDIGEAKRCRLAIHSKTNIVADGLVFERNGLDEKIHGVLLGEKNVRVSIKKVFSPNDILPIPVPGEMEMVKDALGSLVAWPEELVLLGIEDEINDDRGDKQGVENDGDDFDSTMIQAFAQTIESGKKKEILIPLEKEIFGEENLECYVFKKDLIDFCAMKTVDVTLIAAYMRHLYAKFERSREIIKFVNPASISTVSRKELSRLITKRLAKGKRNQICFIPYNIQSKFHWVLMVIDCSSMNVYWLDSLHTQPDEQMKFYINSGLLPLRVNKTKGSMPTWNIITGPRQPDNVQCGYYVMKFMRKLIEEPSQSIEMKMRKLAGKGRYTREEINEVRVELIELVMEHIEL